ncbi:hypothetical protein EV182_003608, partial [Spiromyces aspiralis]
MVETRRKRTRRTDVSAAYYVGYVEDDESVDAIMKKFEELERIEKEFAAKSAFTFAANDDGTGADTISGGDAATEATQHVGDNSESKPSGLSAEQLQEVFKRTSAFT